MTYKGAKIVLFFIACALQEAVAQSLDSLPYTLTVEEDILGMELRSEQDSDQSIYIISKGDGSTENATLSSTLITREEIMMSGATNLLEVLRLSPEVIIRQSSNGNFTLHLRGSSSPDALLDNRNSILLMINEIPFYDFPEQIVWWEALPVALQDIEQIEIVRTMHSAWYGPEATDGIVNIVTKSDNGAGFRTRVNSQAGLRGNYAHQGSIGINQGGRFRTKVSAFYNQRSRFQDAYYIFSPQRYVSSDSLLFYQINAESTNPNVRNSMQNSGIHFNANYQWNNKVGMQIGAGMQESEAQGVFRRIEQIALTNRLANTNWLYLRSRWKSLTTYASFQTGMRAYNGYDGYQWDDTQQLLGRIEYARRWKKYRIGLGTEVLHYKYKNNSADSVREENIANLPFPNLLTQRYSISLSQQLSVFGNRMKVTLAHRGDYYLNAEQLILSHQLSSSYRISAAHKLNATISHGERSPDAHTYLIADTMRLNMSHPQTMMAYEAMYQFRITKNIGSEFTFFQYQPTGETDGSSQTNISQYQRSGITGKIDWQINRLYLSGFATSMRYNPKNGSAESHPLPSFFGGITGRYTALFGKLQAYASVHYYTRHEFSDEEQSYSIPAKLTLNGKLSYRIWEEHSVFFSSQNLLDNRKVEYPFGDQTRGMYWIGMNLRF